jgi:hypothetical protein
MSETTDATAPPTSARASLGSVREAAATKPERIPARDLVRLAQGFYFIFWGLLLAVLVGSQSLAGLFFQPIADLLLAGGVLGTLAGSWRLHQAKSVGPLWQGRARWTLALAMLMTYFCIFFCMWRRMPQNTYLLANALAFVGTSICYMVALNRSVAALARVYGRRELVVESRVFGASNIGILMVPFVGALAYVCVMAIRHQTSPLVELEYLFYRASLLVVILLLLPFSLTLSLAWVAKDATLRELSCLDADRETATTDR